MPWTQPFYGGLGWYTGTAAQGNSDIPALLPVSIGSHEYLVEGKSIKRSTVPITRPGVDQAAEPGEVSLSTEGLWRRSQSDWRYGANQLMFDEADSKRTRYWQGKGVNPHPDTPADAYQLRLHKDTVQVKTATGGNLQLLPCGSFLYMVDGSNLYFTNILNGGSTSWTDSGMSTATGGATISSICFDGAFVYVAVGSGGIYRTAVGSTGTAVPFLAAVRQVDIVGYAGGNLFGSHGPTMWQFDAQGQSSGDVVGVVATLTAPTGTSPITSITVSPTALAIASGASVTLRSGTHSQTFTASTSVGQGATTIPVTSATPAFNYPVGAQAVAVVTAATGLLIYTHPNPSFVWQTFQATPQGVFVSGNSGIAGEMYRIDIDTSTGALVAPASMFILPSGEALNDMVYYSGALVLATSAGVRVATVQIQFVISVTYGPVIQIPGGVTAIWAQGEWAWFTWTNYDAVSTGLGRLDLARFALDEIPSMSSDLMTPSSASHQGPVTDVAQFGGAVVFAVGSVGVFAEHPTNYVPSGWINSGRIKYGTTEKKFGVAADFYHDPLPLSSSIEIQVVDELGITGSPSASNNLGSVHPSGLLSLNSNATSEQLSLLITIINGTDLTAPPLLRRWTLYSLVAPRRVDLIEVPIILRNEVRAPSADGVDVSMDTLAEWQYLKGLEAAGTPIIYIEGDNAQQVYISQIEVDGDRWSPDDHHWLEGTCTVRMITLDSGAFG